MNFQTYGGRRFLLALGAGVVTTLLQWFGKLDSAGTTYGLTIAATVAAYITGNVQETKFTSQVRGERDDFIYDAGDESGRRDFVDPETQPRVPVRRPRGRGA